ncbi:MAG TPA: glycosyltransferase [Candidatus Portnoybacteria bacterium]|nr:glycosyltransferase [Candidatus Portnoybacteria bacterium]
MDNSVFVIPTYNERENIGRLIEKIFELSPEAKVLIVDDSSPDGTAQTVKELQGKYPGLFLFVRPVKEGLGKAYVAGFQKVFNDFPEAKTIFMMDADFSHDPNDLPAIIENSKKYDVVIGSCHINPKEGMSEYPFKRALLSRWANFYCRCILGRKLRDWTNAYMAISVPVLKKISFDKLQAKEFAFLFGLRYLLLKNKATFKEIPTIIRLRNAGESKMALSTIMEAVIMPWEIRFGLPAQVVKFLISGGTATLVGFIALYAFTEFAGIWYLFSVVLAFIFSFIVSFTLQKFWTFDDRRTEKMHHQAFFYLLTTLTNLLLNLLIVFLLVEKAGLWYMLAQFIAEAVIAVESFLVYKFAIFKVKK